MVSRQQARVAKTNTWIDRRTLLRIAGGIGITGIAGCTSDDEPDAQAQEMDDEDSESKDFDEESEPDDGSDDGPGNESDRDGDESTAELRPSELGLEPDDAWDDTHPDIDIPNEPGRAILLLGEDRFEFEGDLSGGPNYGLHELVLEADEFEGDGAYFLLDGLFQPTEDTMAEHGWEEGYNIRFLRRMVGWSGNQFSYVNADELELHWPNIVALARYFYRENADGSTERGEIPGTTYAEEPFLRIDPSGVVTATGTITDPGQSDISEGTTFEFGARAQDDWVERYDE